MELESGLGDAVCEMRLPNHRLETFRFWFLAPAMGVAASVAWKTRNFALG